MKQADLTKKQKKILEEIRELVVTGQKKLKEFSEESLAIEKKWQKIAENRNLTVRQPD